MPRGYLQEREKKERKFKRVVNQAMKDKKLTQQDMADKLELNNRQDYAYRLNKCKFGFFELRRVFEILQLEDEEILDLMREKK